MSKTDKAQSGLVLLTILVLLLFMIAGIQAWYMIGIKKQLDTIQDKHSLTELTDQSLTAQETAEQSAHVTETKTPAAQLNNETMPDQENSAQDTLAQEQQAEQAAQPGNNNLTPATPPSFPDNGYFNSPYYSQPWSPHEEIQRMQRHMERTFNDSYYDHPRRPDFHYRFQQNISMPEIDVREDNNQYTILVNLPGADEKDIAVNLDGQRLTVKGRQHYEKQDRNAAGNITFSERRSGDFRRSIILRSPVVQNSMKSRVDKGVLIITILKI